MQTFLRKKKQGQVTFRVRKRSYNPKPVKLETTHLLFTEVLLHMFFILWQPQPAFLNERDPKQNKHPDT